MISWRPTFPVPMSAVLSLVLALALALALSPADALAQTDNAPADAPAGVAEDLVRFCDQLTSGSNEYFGPARLRALEAQLEVTPPAAVDRRARFLGAIATYRLRLGRLDAALDAFRQALELAETAGLAPDLVDQLRFGVGLAEMVRAEERNCVTDHNAASCVLPLAPAALHRDPEPARRAAEHFRALLEGDPGNVQARWLLVLATMISGGDPATLPEALRPPADAPWLEDSPSRWTNVASGLGIHAFELAGGVATDDFDGDGVLDIVFTSWHPCTPATAYRGDGEGGWVDVSEAWGLDDQLGGLNLSHADFDNDGDLDLLILRGAWLGTEGRIPNSLLRNDLATTGRFTDVTRRAGLAEPAYPTQAAGWADYDGDGDLDLYIGNEATGGNPALTTATAVPPSASRTYPSQLFENRGDGTFVDVAEEAGVLNHSFAKGVAWGDVDDDGDPDLFVSNIGPNRLYINRGDGTFEDRALEAGVSLHPHTSFATWFFDWENDGDLDLFINDYNVPYERVAAHLLGVDRRPDGHPVLYLNDGGGRFTDVSIAAGLDFPALPMGSNYGDLDNDGFPDVRLGTGIPNPAALMPNLTLRNVPAGEGAEGVGGRRFEEATFVGGFGHLQKGHGVAFADLDGDGDQEIVEQIGGAYPFDDFANAVWENPGNDHRWIVLRLEGREANRRGVGARIEVRVRDAGDEGQGQDNGRSIHVLAGTGGSFGSSSLDQEIGLGDAAAIEWIRVRWPGSGTIQTLDDVAMDRAYRVIEGEDRPVPLERPRFTLDRPDPDARGHVGHGDAGSHSSEQHGSEHGGQDHATDGPGGNDPPPS